MSRYKLKSQRLVERSGRYSPHAEYINQPKYGSFGDKEFNRYHGIYSRYGITREEYKQMLVDQGGQCCLCKQFPMPDNQLVIDHNHETDEVRGLLCIRCNNAVWGYEIVMKELGQKEVDEYISLSRRR